MAEERGFPKRRQTSRLAIHERVERFVHVLYETAWADAWPYLDGWFMPEAFFIERSRCLVPSSVEQAGMALSVSRTPRLC